MSVDGKIIILVGGFDDFTEKISAEQNCQNQNVNNQKILKCLKLNFINQLYMNSDRDGVIDKKNSFATFS